jgi:hypothetical protein
MTWRIRGFSFSVRPSAILGTILLWGILSWVALQLLSLPLGEALLLGLLATTAHWILDVIHQLGHAWAASRTGYAMIGIRFWWVLSTCLYPSNEPELPKRLHVRRALGGPALSVVVLILAAVWIWLIWPPQRMVEWLIAFILVDDLLTFTLGVFLPLGFTDGSTLLRLWRN